MLKVGSVAHRRYFRGHRDVKTNKKLKCSIPTSRCSCSGRAEFSNLLDRGLLQGSGDRERMNGCIGM